MCSATKQKRFSKTYWTFERFFILLSVLRWSLVLAIRTLVIVVDLSEINTNSKYSWALEEMCLPVLYDSFTRSIRIANIFCIYSWLEIWYASLVTVIKWHHAPFEDITCPTFCPATSRDWWFFKVLDSSRILLVGLINWNLVAKNLYWISMRKI